MAVRGGSGAVGGGGGGNMEIREGEGVIGHGVDPGGRVDDTTGML